MNEDYRDEIGRRLRDIRHQQDLTLDEVEAATGGRFTAAAVASWERGARNVTTPKLAELADFYGVPADRLLPDPTLTPPTGGQPIDDRSPLPTVDLSALQHADHPGVGIIARYVEHIRQRRNDHSARITLRCDDLRKLAALLGITVEDCRRLLLDPHCLGDPDSQHDPIDRVGRPDGPHLIIDIDASTNWASSGNHR